MHKFIRRSFLKKFALLGATAAAFSAKRHVWSLPAEPHLDFPTQPRERLAVASWPFREFIEAPTNKWARNPEVPGMDLTEFPAMIMKKFGLRNIEPLDSHFRSTDTSYLHQFREAVEKSGSHIVDIPVDGRYSFYDPDATNRRRAVDTGKKWIGIAVALGSPSIRIHIAGVHNLKPDADRTAESLKDLAAFGAEKNVLVNLENDDNFTEDPFFIVAVIEKVSNPYLHALPDFCNSMLTHDQDFNNRGLTAMFKHAYNIAHVKDSEVGDHGKVYTVEVAKCFEISKASGYRGYFSMEWEGQGEPYAGTQKLIDESLKYLA
jgi:sugar phosphate isomerase/epimerase